MSAYRTIKPIAIKHDGANAPKPRPSSANLIEVNVESDFVKKNACHADKQETKPVMVESKTFLDRLHWSLDKKNPWIRPAIGKHQKKMYETPYNLFKKANSKQPSIDVITEPTNMQQTISDVAVCKVFTFF